MKTRRTWQQKFDDANAKGLPRVITLGTPPATQTCIIPAPREVDALMRTIPEGKLTTINALRTALAKKHNTDIACPITTGIFAWIAAHVAAEAESAGKKRVTPYWRTLKLNGELNARYPDGIANLTRRLRAEGHKVIQRGKRFFVKDHQLAIATLKG